MKRLDLIERKLQAIRDKDIAEIVSKKVPLPISSFSSVDDWLRARTVVLENARLLSESAIKDKITKLYSALSEESKQLVDNEDIPSGQDYETFIEMHLYKFSLGLFG